MCGQSALGFGPAARRLSGSELKRSRTWAAANPRTAVTEVSEPRSFRARISAASGLNWRKREERILSGASMLTLPLIPSCSSSRWASWPRCGGCTLSTPQPRESSARTPSQPCARGGRVVGAVAAAPVDTLSSWNGTASGCDGPRVLMALARFDRGLTRGSQGKRQSCGHASIARDARRARGCVGRDGVTDS